MPEYRPVPGFIGYRAGDDGTIWSILLRRAVGDATLRFGGEWKQIKGSPDSRGYLIVSLCRDGKSRISRHVHSLVLETFVGPCPAGKQCRHLDDIKSNNTVGNLAWGTSLENGADKKKNKCHASGEDHVNAKLTNEQVAEIRRMKLAGVGRKEIVDKFPIGLSEYQRIVHNKFWHDPDYTPPVIAVDYSFEAVREAALARGTHMKEIPGYPGYYAKTDGTIWSAWVRTYEGLQGRGPKHVINSNEKHQLRGNPATKYPQVMVKTTSGNSVTKQAHYLILLTFVCDTPNGCQCRHLNDIPTDNRLENLTWGTSKQNHADRILRASKST